MGKIEGSSRKRLRMYKFARRTGSIGHSSSSRSYAFRRAGSPRGGRSTGVRRPLLNGALALDVGLARCGVVVGLAALSAPCGRAFEP